VDRLELNAHIERLIESRGGDAQARAALEEFACTLKRASPVALEGMISRPGGTVSGQTPEHGSVQVDDDRARTTEFSKGVVRERVGYYKLTRQTKDLLIISHFWKADEGTQSETELAPEWAMGLDADGKAAWFGERARKPVFRLPFTRHLVIDVSRDVYVETWGPALESQHKGGYFVAVIVSG
jgi:hypothetical protein